MKTCKNFALFCLFIVTITTKAQVNTGALPSTLTQNFSTLPTSGSDQSQAWNNNSTIIGWYSDEGTLLYGGNYKNGSSGTAGLRAFGSPGNDMALGSVAANGNDNAIGFRVRNNSGSQINSVTVTYTGEQWRFGENYDDLQSLQFSYRVGNTVNTLSNTAFDANYMLVPELSFVGPNNTASTGGLDGTSTTNKRTLSFKFNVTIANNQEIMFRWHDSDQPGKLDHGLAIDDVSITFSTTSNVTEEFIGGNVSMYHYAGGAIVGTIMEDAESLAAFEEPSGAQLTSWRGIVDEIITAIENNTDVAGTTLTAAANLGYKIIKYEDQSDVQAFSYYVLRHNGNFSATGNEDKQWGTYIFNRESPPTTTRQVTTSAPHPLFDKGTGRQAAYMYHTLREWSFMHAVSGVHRCTSVVESGCSGTSESCGGGNYTVSDQAHYMGPFQAAVEQVEIAALSPNLLFPQFHQFAFVNGDPDFIISNGTDESAGGGDIATKFRTYILNNTNPDLVVHAPHFSNPNTATKLFGYTNTQGRYLNDYPHNICTSNNTPNNPTDRFLHIEQLEAYTTDETNYNLVKEALIFAYGLDDATKPDVAVSSTETSPTNANPIPFTITFSEPVTGLAENEITVINGSVVAASLSTSNNKVYTVNITPAGQGAVTVSIPANVAADAAANTNNASPGPAFSLTYDSNSPTVTTITDTNGVAPRTDANPITVTLTFNEPIDAATFTAADVTVGNGTAGNLQSIGGNVYTVDITPTSDGLITVDLPADAVTDVAGNGNTAATQFADITFDRDNAPTFIGGGDLYILTGDNATKTYTDWATYLSTADNELQKDGVSAQALTTINVVNNNNGLFSVQPSIDIATGTLTFTPTGAAGTATVTVTITDNGVDNALNDNQSVQTFKITVGTSFLVLNEIMPFPGTSDPALANSIDCNLSGVLGFDNDEYIEAVNYSASTLDITGWQLFDYNATDGEILRHTFPATILEPYQAIVVFGQGSVPDNLATIQATYPDVIFQNSTGGPEIPAGATSLGLFNGGDIVIIKNGGGTEQTRLAYPDRTTTSTNRGRAYSRNSDIFGHFKNHPTNSPPWFSTVESGATAGRISPGRRVDNSRFPNDPPTFTSGGNVVQPAVAGNVTIFGWASNINDGDPDLVQTVTFNIASEADPSNIVSAIDIDETTGNLSFTLSGNIGVATITINLSDNGPGTSPNDNTGDNVVFTITVSNTQIVLNEILIWPAQGCAVDDAPCNALPEVNANGGDNIFGAISDEFIELVNTGNANADLTGWAIDVNGEEKYVFDALTLVPNQAVVVFGGTTVDATKFPGVLTRTTAGLSLINGSDNTITIRTSSGGSIYASHTFAAIPLSRGVSQTRSPELTGIFASHAVPSGNSPWKDKNTINNSAISPGRRSDLTHFYNDAPTFTGGGNVNEGSVLNPTPITRAGWATNIVKGGSDESGQSLTFNVTVDSDPNTVLNGVLPTIDTDDGDLHFTIAGGNVTGTATITVTLSDNGSNTAPNSNTSASYQFTINIGAPWLVINEIVPFPGAAAAPGQVDLDLSGEGTYSVSSDEVIELVNVGDIQRDLNGWKIRVNGGSNFIEYKFTAQTLIEPNQSVVIFGTGAVPTASIYTNAGVITVVAPTVVVGENGGANTAAGLGLTNTGATVTVIDNSGVDYASVTYGDHSTSGRAISTTRSPDLTGAFANFNHPVVYNSPWWRKINATPTDKNVNASPGRRTDGTHFYNDPPTVVGTAISAAPGVEQELAWITDGDPDLTQIVTSSINITSNPNNIFETGPLIDDATGTLSFKIKNTATAGQAATLQITLTDNGPSAAPNDNSEVYNVTVTVTNATLVINELLAWPNGSVCTEDGATCPSIDANVNGVLGTGSDEFIEFVNTGSTELNITGWEVWVGDYGSFAREHTFASVSLLPGQSIVVFGEGSTPDAQLNDDGTVVVVSTSSAGGAGLGLTNTGRTIQIRLANGTVYTAYTYSNQVRSKAIVRTPDVTGAFAQHALNSDFFINNTDGSTPRISPGRRSDNTSFLNDAPTFTISAPYVYAKPNSSQRVIANFVQDIDDGDPELAQTLQISTSNDNNALFAGQPVVSLEGTLTFTVANNVTGEAIVTVTLQDDGSGFPQAYQDPKNTQKTFTIRVTNDNLVVINEILPWPTGGPTINANGVTSPNDGGALVNSNPLGQGTANGVDDEFIELVNYGDTDINIGGWKLLDGAGAGTLRHTFPNPTTLTPGQSIVVYGKGTQNPLEVPSLPYLGVGEAILQVNIAATTTLAINNDGDVITLRDGSDNIIDQFTYTEEQVQEAVSFTRLPDVTGAWFPHPANAVWTNSSGGAGRISPARAVDNSSFIDNNAPEFANGGNVFVFENSGAHQINNWAWKISDGSIIEDKTLVFDVQNTNGTEAYFSTPPAINAQTGQLTFTLNPNVTGTAEFTVTLTQTEDGGLSSTPFDFFIQIILEGQSAIVFNEAMSWPTGDNSNAALTDPIINSDGQGDSPSSNYDEFVELVNAGNSSKDISGWKISDGTVRHIFPANTVLEPGQAIVVFGKDPANNPVEADFGGALVQEASNSSSVGLLNSGDIIYLLDAGDNEMDRFAYKGSVNRYNIRSISFSRVPDITGAFAHHPDNFSLPNPDNNGQPANISPGRKTDGSLFNSAVSGEATWTMNWDNTNLYINVKVTSLAHAPVVYIDADPLPIINGGTNANGSLSGQAYDNITFNPAFRADYMVYFKQGTLEQRTDNGAGGWNAGNNTNLNYNANGTTHTLTIPWANITGGAKPASFAWAGYVSYISGNNFIYGALPLANSADDDNVNPIIVNATYYQLIQNTDVAEDPFAKESYASRDGDSPSAFEVFNFTVASGHTVTLAPAPGTRTVAGLLRVNGTLDMNFQDISISGSLNNTGGTLSNPGTVSFTGSTPATITGATTFTNLQINNSGGVTLNDPVTITGQLRLVNGVLTTTSVNLLTLNDGATTSALTSDSYVDGPLKKIGDDPFIFPVGNAGVFAPIATEALANTSATDAFTAQYFRSAAPNGDQISGDAPNFITKVSAIEYWDLDRTVGSPNAQVRLYFNSLSASDIQNTSTMRVGHYTGGQWQDEGGSWTNGVTANTGSVLSANVLTTFSPMAPASDESNSLPIELLSFSGTYENNAVELKWETASEENVASFELLRSANGTDFELLATIAATNQLNGARYTHTDRAPLSGVSYYQLRSVDKDGTVSSYSRVVQVEVPVALGITVYPNPVDPETTQVSVALAGVTLPQTAVHVYLYDSFGKQILNTNTEIDTETKHLRVNIPRGLTQGVYLLRVNLPGVTSFKIQVNR